MLKTVPGTDCFFFEPIFAFYLLPDIASGFVSLMFPLIMNLATGKYLSSLGHSESRQLVIKSFW